MNIIGQALFEAAAQTFTGALANYTFDRIKNGIYQNNSFNGAFDLWQRGIHCKSIDFGDSIGFDGLLSPYIQLFPRDPYQNAKRWSTLFEFDGKIDSNEFSALEFYAGSDETIRTGSLNGETLVGLYNRYGYVGEGVLGVISTSYLLKQIPEFFQKDYWGSHVKLTATLSKCPSQHGFVAQGMFQKVGITLNTDSYKEHIDYERIYYTRDEYAERISTKRMDIEGTAQPRRKFFKVNKAAIPFDYPCSALIQTKSGYDRINCPFIFFILNCYFQHKDLLNEYFNDWLQPNGT